MNKNEKQIVETIRSEYDNKEQEISKIDELKLLDKKTKLPAKIFAYIFGSFGTLVLGAGMCLAMPEVIEGYMPLGIGVGIVGIVMVSINYALYKTQLKARKRRMSGEIIKLSDEILGN